MDNITSKERGFESDLESGWISSEEDTSKGSGNRQVKNLLSKVTCGFGFNGSIGGECVANSCGNSGKTSEVVSEDDLELLIDECSGREESGEHAAVVDKKHMKEIHKKANSKKAAKPPRPPKGPALDASDLKLVKEISELAVKKRAKIERMKVLKKMKAAKSSSSNSSLVALLITIIFCLIILLQGICSRNSSSMNFHGSPEPSVATDSLISVQFYSNPSPSDGSGPSSASPNSVENGSHSELRSSG